MSFSEELRAIFTESVDTPPPELEIKKVALYTEGTYPQAHGGVGVWVDQLVSGLNDHHFEVRAITGSPFMRSAYQVPQNVHIEQVPLWGKPLGKRNRDRAFKQQVVKAYGELLEALFMTSVDGFQSALKSLSGLGMQGNLTRILDGAEAGRVTMQMWEHHAQQRRDLKDPDPLLEQLPMPTVTDALNIQVWLEHALRPLNTQPPEVEVGHAVSNGFAVLLALHGLWQHKTPFLLTEHGVYLRERYLEFRKTHVSPGYKTILLRFYRLLCSVAYREARLILPGSLYNRRWEEKLGAKSERIQCVYNGIDPNIFPQADSEPDEPVISWAGRVDPLKDLETLIRAFAYVHKEIPEAKLRLFGGTPAGNEPYEQHCRNLVTQLGLTENVQFEGRIPDITDAYRAGQVVALTSVSEGFPYTVIEAMAMGRPMVATRVGGVPEAVGDAGFIVSPRDAKGASEALIKMLKDAPMRAKLGQAAHMRVLNYFTLEGCLEAYRRAYPMAKAKRLNPKALEVQSKQGVAE